MEAGTRESRTTLLRTFRGAKPARAARVLLLASALTVAGCFGGGGEPDGSGTDRPESSAVRAAPDRDRAAPPAAERAWTTVARRLGNWPFLVPIAQLPPLRAPGGGTFGVRAAECGACHREIYREWKRSTHATALRDLQYLAELAKPDSPRWLCLNCHIPVQNQRAYLVTASTRLEDRGDDLRFLEELPNPGFDAAMQAESITCAACHVRLDPDGRSVVVGPRGRSDRSPHPVRADRAALRSTCVRCHSPGPARLTPTFFCWFETAEELRGGPHAGKKDCADCHMPRDAGGRARHHWTGGGVPKWYDDYDSLLARGWEPGLEVSPVEFARAAGGLRVRVSYANARSGHRLPTADPERFILLEAAIVAADGRAIARERLRIGQRWDWGDLATARPARRLEDNRLGPGERRTWELTLPEPPAGARLVVSARHVRLVVPNARHMRQTRVDEMEPFLPGVTAMVAEIERHYPLFSWVHREEIALDEGARTTWTRRRLVEASKRSRDLDLDRLAELTSE